MRDELNVLTAIVAAVFILLPTRIESVCPDIVSRQDWNASEPTSIKSLKQDPPPYVVVHHSAGRTCNETDDCKRLVKAVQTYHMVNKGWEDIGYNFLIGSDGVIIEGRGWGIHGAHAIPYNARSLGICLLGNFVETEPSEDQLDALQKLINCSVEKGKLTTDYHLIGHNQASATLCPGRYLYRIIQEWSHFDKTPQ